MNMAVKVYHFDHIAAWYWNRYASARNHVIAREAAIKWAEYLDKSTNAENR